MSAAQIAQVELTGGMFIAGTRVTGTAGEVRGVDPRRGAELEPGYGLAGAQDVTAAAAAAWDAFHSYRRTSPGVRAAFLRGIAGAIDEIGGQLPARVVAETGIPPARVAGELTRTTNQLRLFATLVEDGRWEGARIDPALPDRRPLPRPDIRQRKVPLGPVAVFSASNFPLAFSVAGGDTASALAAGCPVIVKAHSSHPGTSELVAAAITRAVAAHDLHPGVFSMLYGDGRTTGVALVRDERVRAVGFTGSRSGGLALMKVAAGRPTPIPFYGEMSSVNPVFLLPHALAARGGEIGTAFAASCLTGAGQLCTNPGLVFAVAGAGLDAFLDAATAELSAVSTRPMLNAAIAGSYAQGVDRLRAHPAVREVAAGARDDEVSLGGRPHLFTTDAATFLADASLQQEVFGSTSLVVSVAEPARMSEILAVIEPQLTATIHAAADDLPLAKELLDAAELKAGRVIFNEWPTGVDVGHAMVHGGPFPATSDGRSTSVGTAAIERFLRPVAYQGCPPDLLPAAVDVHNSRSIWRLVDGEPTRD